MPSQLLPIAVDLDGTLLHTDTLHESCLQLFHHNTIKLPMLPLWLMRGKAYLKHKLAEQTRLNPATLPYNLELIRWLKEQKQLGHQLILCTAADSKIAHSIAIHLDLFDEVLTSNGQTNLTGIHKKEALNQRYGERQYIYVGNANPDLEVWNSAAQAVVVNADKNLIEKCRQVSEIIKIFPPLPITLNTLSGVFRTHQYIKNLLLFVPLAAAHKLGQIDSIILLSLAFASFSLCASAVYIMNDLMDLEHDRQHPRKKNRPFTSGVVPIQYGVILASISLLLSLACANFVGSDFLNWLVAYFVITIAYSMRLKRYVLIDCLTLAALYTLRIIAGAATVAISLSFWLLAFSIFLFLSLAFVKRYAELKIQILHSKTHAHGRGYHVEDAPLIQTLGVTAGYASVLVLALYLDSETVISLYATPQLIWLAVPLLLFWISWMWMKAHRGDMHDDPIVFAIKDKTSLIVGLLWAMTFAIASAWGNL